MAGNVPSRLIGELTFQEVSQRLRSSSILCLPIGSIEQHGHHLPVGTDIMLAEAVAKRLAERLDAYLLPPLAITAWLGSWQINTAYGAALSPELSDQARMDAYQQASAGLHNGIMIRQ